MHTASVSVVSLGHTYCHERDHAQINRRNSIPFELKTMNLLERTSYSSALFQYPDQSGTITFRGKVPKSPVLVEVAFCHGKNVVVLVPITCCTGTRDDVVLR